MIEGFMTNVENGANAYETAVKIFNDSKIASSLKGDNTPEQISKRENLEELLNGVKEFTESRIESGEENVTLTDFLSEVSLATDADEEDEIPEPKVTLMTVHASKGLEFKHIFIAGMEEELFPSALSLDSLEQIEEERRLFYVAITRAKKTCTITYAGSRFRNGETKLTRPSRFIREIDREFTHVSTSGNYDNQDLSATSYSKPTSRPQFRSDANRYPASAGYRSSDSARFSSYKPLPASSEKTASTQGLKIGSVIRHSKYGEGEVVGYDEERADIIIINFKNFGIKKLLLKFAKFTILS